MALATNDVLEMSVLGIASGQTVENTLNYRIQISPGSQLTDFADAFRSVWRTQILPLLHDTYTVSYYVARKIHGMVWLDPQHLRPALRYAEQLTLTGDPVDDRGEAVGAVHATFACVGFEKVCATPQTFEPPVTDVLGEKIGKGSIRFGPIAEADTIVAEGNKLTAGAITAWDDAVNDELDQLGWGGSTVATMAVLSFYKDNIHRSRPDGLSTLPTFIVYPVSSLTLNTFLTSQVSRKQRRSGA